MCSHRVCVYIECVHYYTGHTPLDIIYQNYYELQKDVSMINTRQWQEVQSPAVN